MKFTAMTPEHQDVEVLIFEKGIPRYQILSFFLKIYLTHSSRGQYIKVVT